MGGIHVVTMRGARSGPGRPVGLPGWGREACRDWGDGSEDGRPAGAGMLKVVRGVSSGILTLRF